MTDSTQDAPERMFLLTLYEDRAVCIWHKRMAVEYVRADRIEELEAKLAKAMEALQWLKVEIRGHGFSDEGRMLTMCISTLAELTGGKDE